MINNPDSTCSYDRWARVWHDVIEAKDKIQAKKIVSEDLDAIIAEKVTAKSKIIPDYRIFITELTPSWEEHWLKERICGICGTMYTLLQSKQLNTHSTHEHCSYECQRLTRRETDFGDYKTVGSHRPCIYKITNKKSGMVYIGQTTQCFTLRWYQHFFHAKDTKFHEAIKASKPEDWTFEVVEVIYGDNPGEVLNQREQYWIEYYDAINAGLNTKKVSSCTNDK